MVNFAKDTEEFNATLRSNDLVVVDFTASWCGPCKMISPHFERLAAQYQAMKFMKVDVDDLSEVAGDQNVNAMPTFKVFLKGRVIKEMKGADPTALENMIRESAELYNSRFGPVTETEEQLMQKSIKELKDLLRQKGLSDVGLAEKEDLVKRLKGSL